MLRVAAFTGIAAFGTLGATQPDAPAARHVAPPTVYVLTRTDHHPLRLPPLPARRDVPPAVTAAPPPVQPTRVRAARKPVITAVRPAAPASGGHDRLVGPGLNVPVTTYGDCSGRTPLTRAAVAIDTCVGWDTYFLGHNPGLFTPIMRWGAGTLVTWYDNAGRAHQFRIAGWVSAPGGSAPRPRSGTVAQFQTCAVPSGAVIRVLYAVAA